MLKKITIGIILTVPLFGTVMLKSVRYQAWFELNGYPKVSNPFTLTLKIRALTNSPRTKVEFSLPNGVSQLDGNISWDGDLSENDTISLSANLCIQRLGAYHFYSLIQQIET